MCTTCGCGPEERHRHHAHPHRHGHVDVADRAGDLAVKTLRVETDILAKNSALAGQNRVLFHHHGIFVINLMSSPGSGKTTLLERTLADLNGKVRVAVIEGDQQTDNDAIRIAATGTPVQQVNTGAGCHLDAHMILHACEHFDLDSLDVLVIENVGNLVCPASFDLGEHHKVVVLSVTEGEDKPLKYPAMFRNADVMLLNKIDLLPHVDFQVEQCLAFARQVNPEIEIFLVSSATSEGMDAWYSWLASGTRK